MGEPGRRAHLALEALDALGVARELGRHGLQRYLAAEALVRGAVDVRHAAPAQQGDDAVVTETGAGIQCH